MEQRGDRLCTGALAVCDVLAGVENDAAARAKVLAFDRRLRCVTVPGINFIAVLETDLY